MKNKKIRDEIMTVRAEGRNTEKSNKKRAMGNVKRRKNAAGLILALLAAFSSAGCRKAGLSGTLLQKAREYAADKTEEDYVSIPFPGTSDTENRKAEKTDKDTDPSRDRENENEEKDPQAERENGDDSLKQGWLQLLSEEEAETGEETSERRPDEEETSESRPDEEETSERRPDDEETSEK